MINNVSLGSVSYSNTYSVGSQQSDSAENTTRSASSVVDISAAAFALQTNNFFTGALPSPYSQVAAFEFDLANIPLSEANQKRVDTLNQELDQIFGVPKDRLTGNEKTREAELVGAIDKILQKTEPQPFTQAQERQFDRIQEQIDQIFADGQVTAEEEQKLQSFDARLEELFQTQTPAELSQQEQQQLDGFYRQLDELYGLKQPSQEQLIRAEEIFTELDSIYETSFNNSFAALSNEGQEQASQLIDQINQLFNDALSVNFNPATQDQIDSINKEIDSLLGLQPLSEANAKQAEQIDRQIDQIFADGHISAEEETLLDSLDKQLEEIFGPPKELSNSENQRLNELFDQLDTLYQQSSNTAPALDFNVVAQLSEQLNSLFSNGNGQTT